MRGLYEERFGGSGRGVKNEMREGGLEMAGGDGNETGSVTKKKENKKSTTSISASLTPDFRDKEESNNNNLFDQI